jgi:hypothetical protein
MAGERDNRIDGPVDPDIAEVVQGAGRDGAATGTSGAGWAAAGREVAAARDEARRRKILDAGNTFGGIGHLLAGSKHDRLRRKQRQESNLRDQVAVAIGTVGATGSGIATKPIP